MGLVKGESSLRGTVSGKSELSGKLSSTGKGYDIYDGEYSVVPKAFQSQTLETAKKFLQEDITVSEVPYWETSNQADGLTVYIAEEISENGNK